MYFFGSKTERWKFLLLELFLENDIQKVKN